MKNGRSLTELANEIQRQSETKRDFGVGTSQLMVETKDGSTNLAIEGMPGERFGISNHCHGQIASRLNYPKKFYDHLRNDHSELFDHTVNQLFRLEPERRMIRTLDGDARAFLSNRYRRIDNLEVAEAVLPVLQGAAEMTIASCEVTTRRLYIKAIFPKTEMEVKVGDPVQAGVVISNSEIGAGRFMVESLVYRLVCSNGMISPDYSFRKNHTGKVNSTGEDALELFRDETIRADDRALMLKMQDLVTNAMNATGFGAIVRQMQETTERHIEGDPVKAVEVLANRYTLQQSEQTSVLTHLIQGGDLSQYGVLNAVTRASQDVTDYDRATELERLGGTVLTLPEKDWKAIAEAN